MKILNLKLRGFIGIRAGIGLDEIELNFADLSGLIAIAGQNGKGKTTILENLHPYRTLVSRDGALQHHVFLRDSFKELTFIHGGNKYRCMVQVDAHTGKQDCFIYVNDSTASVVDGKTGEYDRFIRELFGSTALYFNSAFCAQGSDKLNDLTTGQLKELFNEFLQLDKLVAWEKTAKEIRNVAAEKNQALGWKIGAISDQLAKHDTESATKLATLNAKLKALESERQTLTESAGSIDRKIIELEQQEKTNAVISEQAASIRARMVESTNEFAAWCVEYRKEREEREIELATTQDRLTTLGARISRRAEFEAEISRLEALKQREASLRHQLAQNNRLLHQASDELRKAQDVNADRSMDIKHQLDGVSEQIESANNIVSNLEKLFAINDAETKEADGHPEIYALKATIENRMEKADDLSLRDPTCQSTTCSFIVSAIQAKEELPVLIEEHKALCRHQIDEVARLKAARAEIELKYNSAQDALKDLKEERKRCQDMAGKIAAEHAKVSEFLNGSIKARVSEIENIEKQLAEIETVDKHLHDAKNEMQLIVVAEGEIQRLEVDALKLKTAIRKAAEGYAELEKKSGAEHRDLSEQIAELEKKMVEGIQSKIAMLKTELVSIKARLPKNADDIRDTREGIAEAQVEDARKKDMEDRRERLIAARDEINHNMGRWEYIRQACSKDGLRALEIDSVAPTLAKDANDLLFGAFGQQDLVKLRTQDPETGKEVLDILIERQDGTEVILDNLSGGQKVWYLKALRLALTLMANHKTGRDIRTAMVDEEDGALDSENAQNFIGMYRSFMEGGGFEDCFFISHKPECVALADHVISVGEGGVSIQ